MPLRANKIAEQLAFHQRELENLIAVAQRKLPEVHAPSVELEQVGRRSGGGGALVVPTPALTAQKAGNTRDQDIEIEGLGQIIVRARFEPLQHIFGASAGGEHEKRCVIARRPQRMGAPEPVFSAKAERA